MLWDLLIETKAALNTINDFETVGIGIEKGINSNSCPAIRIVTESRGLTPNMKYMDKGYIEIVILLDLKNDIETLYEQSIDLEEKVREVLKGIIDFNETLYDKDSVTVFKSTILRYSFGNIRNTKEECSNELA